MDPDDEFGTPLEEAPREKAAAAPREERKPRKPVGTENLQMAQAGLEEYSDEGARYRLQKLIGKGAYGAVYIAHDTLAEPGKERVAVKHIVNAFAGATDARRMFREIQVMSHFDHPNIIRLLRVIRPRETEDMTAIYVVVELMETDLHRVIHSRQDLTSDHISYFVYQLLCALQNLHAASVLHRDLKPSNLLVNADCHLKVCDFGLARETDLTVSAALTEYVVTRWYRAPEVLLSGGHYTEAIDVWSVGCILGELLLRRPLFPGENYLHQLQLIIQTLGSPSVHELHFIRAEAPRNFVLRQPRSYGVPFAKLFPHVRGPCLDLIGRMLVFDPAKRITIEEALAHPFLQRVRAARRHISELPPPPRFRIAHRLRNMSVGEIREAFVRQFCDPRRWDGPRKHPTRPLPKAPAVGSGHNAGKHKKKKKKERDAAASGASDGSSAGARPRMRDGLFVRDEREAGEREQGGGSRQPVEEEDSEEELQRPVRNRQTTKQEARMDDAEFDSGGEEEDDEGEEGISDDDDEFFDARQGDEAEGEDEVEEEVVEEEEGEGEGEFYNAVDDSIDPDENVAYWRAAQEHLESLLAGTAPSSDVDPAALADLLADMNVRGAMMGPDNAAVSATTSTAQDAAGETSAHTGSRPDPRMFARVPGGRRGSNGPVPGKSSELRTGRGSSKEAVSQARENRRQALETFSFYNGVDDSDADAISGQCAEMHLPADAQESHHPNGREAVGRSAPQGSTRASAPPPPRALPRDPKARRTRATVEAENDSLAAFVRTARSGSGRSGSGADDSSEGGSTGGSRAGSQPRGGRPGRAGSRTRQRRTSRNSSLSAAGKQALGK